MTTSIDSITHTFLLMVNDLSDENLPGALGAKRRLELAISAGTDIAKRWVNDPEVASSIEGPILENLSVKAKFDEALRIEMRGNNPVTPESDAYMLALHFTTELGPVAAREEIEHFFELAQAEYTSRKLSCLEGKIPNPKQAQTYYEFGEQVKTFVETMEVEKK